MTDLRMKLGLDLVDGLRVKLDLVLMNHLRLKLCFDLVTVDFDLGELPFTFAK